MCSCNYEGNRLIKRETIDGTGKECFIITVEEKSSSNDEQPKTPLLKFLGKQPTSSTFMSEPSSPVHPKRTKSYQFRATFSIGVYGLSQVGKTTFCIRATKKKLDDKFYIPSVYTERYFLDVQQYNDKYNYIFIVPKSNDYNIINTDCHFVLFDLSNTESFVMAKNLVLEKLLATNKPIFFIGNKCDLAYKIPREEAVNFSKQNNLHFFETSALFGAGFLRLLKTVKNLTIKK